MPATYLRLNDPARQPAANSGTLGAAADASLVVASQSAGPQPPIFPGFDSANLAVALDGAKGWVSAENPPGLNLSGQITLEAWIQPANSQAK